MVYLRGQDSKGTKAYLWKRYTFAFLGYHHRDKAACFPVGKNVALKGFLLLFNTAGCNALFAYFPGCLSSEF
jgi:hypothetical protein